MYICDFGNEISTTVHIIDRSIMFWILKSFSLMLRDTLERTPKVISNQNLFNQDSDLDAEILYKRIKQTDWPWKLWN